MPKKENKILSVFEDLGFANHEEKVAKAELAIQINAAIKARKITRAVAAQTLDLDETAILALYKGRLAGFTIEKLYNYLKLLEAI